MRILNGVDFNLIAQNVGTSVARLHSTYGHINTEQHLAEITKGQGIIKLTETNLNVLPTLEDRWNKHVEKPDQLKQVINQSVVDALRNMERLKPDDRFAVLEEIGSWIYTDIELDEELIVPEDMTNH